MKPHPRIRKTIKWGGAAISLLLLIVWPLSEWRGGRGHTPILPQWELLCAYDSKLWINSPWMGSAFGGNDLGQNVTASDYWPSWSSGGRTGGAAWGASIPIWNALALLVPATTLAWLFDTLARRRAHLNLCPACHYDRTGLPPQSPCPECASPP